MAQKKRSPNASGSIFGWHFQTAAGIYLFLKNIEHAEAIGLGSRTYTLVNIDE